MAREKCILLYPLSYNDGTPIPNTIVIDFLDTLFNLAQGYTIANNVTGAYRMKSGEKRVDKSLEIWVALEPNDIPQMRRLLAATAEQLGQEAMYFERTGSVIEFIDPPSGGSQP